MTFDPNVVKRPINGNDAVKFGVIDARSLGDTEEVKG